MNKEVTIPEAMTHIKSGMTIMINGFMTVKSPETLIDNMVEQGIDNITLITTDTAVPGIASGKLIRKKAVKKLYASHVGLNPEAGALINSGEMEVELVPQGTLAERIRCGGAGLGGVLTPTGIGTEVENGKQKLTVNGKDYLLELPCMPMSPSSKGPSAIESVTSFTAGPPRTSVLSWQWRQITSSSKPTRSSKWANSVLNRS